MKVFGGKSKNKSNSALVIAAGCAVVFMFIATIISIYLYNRRMDEAVKLLAESTYEQYDSYVVMVTSDDDSDFWQQVYKSAREYGDEHGVYIDLLSDGIDESYTKEDYLEMAIETDCDAIFVEGDDSERFALLLAKAKKKDIPVFTLEVDTEIESRISYIGPNSYSRASLYGEALIENIVDQSKVLVLGSNNTNATDVGSFVTNIQTAIKSMDFENVPLEFETRSIESTDEFAAEEYIKNLFKENDLADVVICLDGETTATFYQAMIDYNKVGQIILLGSSNSSAILTGIKQGVIIGSVYVDSEKLGEEAAKAFIEYRDNGYVSDYISVEANIIDESNVDEFLQEVEDE
ncbi:MAG: substrate-binding domain-containing protein [Pseudobutyrivibrio sp.]|nr:substrate-binding domain-containing protein [Pseudobutyrivibrio sp.]